MTTYVIRNGVIIDKRFAPPRVVADLAHYVISDVMSPVKHMATGKIHDSKAAFRADTRASGCEEVGTDPAGRREKPRTLVTQAEVVGDVKRAIQELNR